MSECALVKIGRHKKTAEEISYNTRIGSMIWELRKVKAVRAKDLAREVGVTPQQLCSYESGVAAISLFLLERMCDVLGVSIADLLQASSCNGFPRNRCARCLTRG
jgi:transcriptional regulator with XRE-family HTH domain